MNKEEHWLLNEKYEGQNCDAYLADLERLHNGEPVDYLIGFSTFLGCKIDLSLRPLIPRTETEYWVEKTIAEIKEQHGNKKIRILDIFSGSGCIGIALLSKLPNANVDFTDYEPRAIEQIKKNISLNNVNSDRYNIYSSDVYEHIPAGNSYDFIFANPPYISRNNIDRVGQSVLDYEPHQALFAEEEGYELIRKTIEGAEQFLSKGGVLFLECDDIQYQAVSDMLSTNNFSYKFFKDQFALWRYVRATKTSR